MFSRRGFLGGLIGAIAAPAVVKATSLMPVRTPLVGLRNLYIGPETVGLYYANGGEWKNIGAVESIGTFGQSFDIDFVELGSSRGVKMRGQRRNQLLEVNHLYNESLIDQLATNTPTEFRFNLDDNTSFEFKATVVEHSATVPYAGPCRAQTKLDIVTGSIVERSSVEISQKPPGFRFPELDLD